MLGIDAIVYLAKLSTRLFPRYFPYVQVLSLLYNPALQPDLDTIIAKAGSKTALAKLLGVTKAAISHWKVIPEKRIWQLKLLRPGWFVG